MEASIFRDYISKVFGPLAKALTDKFNGKSGEIKFLHKEYLKPEFSPDMKFASLSTNTSIVAADVVSLDSAVPLKTRGSFSSAEGEVPKLGMKKSMTESALQALKNLKARGTKENELVKKIFSDVVSGVKGVFERLDIMFLQAMSTGVTLIDESNNTGSGIRIDFGIPNSNLFGVQKKWSDATALPIDDIENVISGARAKGPVPNFIWMDRVTYNVFRKNAQVKEAFAGFNKINANQVFRISKEDLDNFLKEEYSLTIIVIDKTVQIEKGGKKVAIEPWKRGNVTFTVGTDMGTLTWSELAEVDNPVDGVEYGIVDSFILTSIYRTNDPLKENSSVQALALPVLDNTDSIFIMDTNEATASQDAQTEGDAFYLYKAISYTKQSVVDGINVAINANEGGDAAEALIGNADSTLAKKIDKLSNAGVVLFEADLIPGV